VTKKYQTSKTMTSAELRHAMPETVSVAMAEVAEDVQEGLLTLAVGTGLQVMAAMMHADVETVCGPKGKHNPSWAGVRHGTERGSVTLGGRRVPVDHPPGLPRSPGDWLGSGGSATPVLALLAALAGAM